MMLQGPERAKSLASAVVKIARKKGSARLSQADLWDLVKVSCPDEHRSFWSGPYCSAGTVAGLLRFEGWENFKLGWWGGPEPGVPREVGELRRLIEAENVMFWDRHEDQDWRLVHTAWLTAHRDIYDWLTKQWVGGHACRFCRMEENQMVDELRQADFDRRDDVLARRLRGSLVHKRCMPYLLEWHAIAAKYSSEREASAADDAAGRASRYAKVVDAARLEAASGQ
jgi:hypothetical protein